VLAIVAQAVDASQADQALITTQFVTLLEVVWPGSASPIPPVAGARRGRSSRGCRQRRRAIPGARCSAWRGLRAPNRMVDLGPGGIYRPKHRQLAPLNCPMNLNPANSRTLRLIRRPKFCKWPRSSLVLVGADSSPFSRGASNRWRIWAAVTAYLPGLGAVRVPMRLPLLPCCPSSTSGPSPGVW
jgi:hypothetical protein